MASVGGGKLGIGTQFDYRNQVGDFFFLGDPNAESSVREPLLLVDRSSLLLCNELESGFRLDYPHADIGGGNVTLIGYMEIGLT